jgi:hypothetical protein
MSTVVFPSRGHNTRGELLLTITGSAPQGRTPQRAVSISTRSNSTGDHLAVTLSFPYQAFCRVLQLVLFFCRKDTPDRSLRASGLRRGQAQQVSLARALLADPPVVLLDEPFTGVDPGDGIQLRRPPAALRRRRAHVDRFHARPRRSEHTRRRRDDARRRAGSSVLAPPRRCVPASSRTTSGFASGHEATWPVRSPASVTCRWRLEATVSWCRGPARRRSRCSSPASLARGSACARSPRQPTRSRTCTSASKRARPTLRPPEEPGQPMAPDTRGFGVASGVLVSAWSGRARREGLRYLLVGFVPFVVALGFTILPVTLGGGSINGAGTFSRFAVELRSARRRRRPRCRTPVAPGPRRAVQPDRRSRLLVIVHRSALALCACPVHL